MAFLPQNRLAAAGILSMNRRNAEFLLPNNERHRYPLVDDKLETKRLAATAGIAVPELYGVVEMNRQLRELDDLLGDHEDFVIKPAHGSGGNGILVVTGRSQRGFRKPDGLYIDRDALEHHISNILSGMFSLGGVPDQAVIEYRVKFDPVFEDVSHQGVPDVRTIVYKGVPAAGMVRLPTRVSGGKANLHQGAVGVGIDLRTGLTRGGVWHDRPVSTHPDTGCALDGIQIPQWDRLVELASRCYDLVGLGYLGVDVVLDETLGPLVLELNARPGLSIQLANRAGLVGVLRRIDDLESIPNDAVERVALARRILEEER